ncbi:MAG: metal ABC transporter substrate-binding protein [Clostridium sp.]
MKVKLVKLAMALVLSLGLIGCGTNEEKVDDKIDIVVSITPLKEFVEVIGGEKVNVTTFVPEGVEPHDFEPNPRNLELLTKSNIFIYNGLGMEGWLDSVKTTIDASKTQIIDSSNGVDAIKVNDHDHDHDHEGGTDPHIWVSLREAQIQCKNIKEALIKEDSENKAYYEENYNKFMKELQALDEEYKVKFNEVTNKNFVLGHSAFSYLARDYGLTVKSLTNVFSEGEPNMKDLEALVDYCKKNNVKTIFSEQSSSEALSKTLANDSGAKVEKIYSLETKVEGKTYIEAMRYNLEKIYENLKAQS